MLYHEVTASSLVKVDMQGHVVESGTTNFGVNVPGFQLHGAVHAARPDIKCIIHLHTPPVLAVSPHSQSIMKLNGVKKSNQLSVSSKLEVIFQVIQKDSPIS